MDEELLYQVPLFAALPREERAKLRADLRTVELAGGDVLFAEGDAGDRLYVVLRGRLEVVKAVGTKEERILNHCGPGDYLGEISLLEPHGVRTASVRALAPSKLMEMTRDGFNSLLQRQPAIGFHIAKVLSSRLREADRLTIRDLEQKNRELDRAYRELQAAQIQIIEKEKLDHELALAREIQKSMLPRSIPVMEGFEFGASMIPAKAIGGDFFDFIPLGSDSLGIAVGDVSDKGVPAALFMAMVRSLLRAEAHKNLPPREVVQRVNRHLADLSEGGMFVTLLYGLLRQGTRSFEYARAGHEIPVMCDLQGLLLSVPRGKGQALGISDVAVVDEQSIHLTPGCTLLIYSDGVTDATNTENEFFGIERVRNSLRGLRQVPAQSVCDNLLKLVVNYQGGVPRHDDVTVVVIRAI